MSDRVADRFLDRHPELLDEDGHSPSVRRRVAQLVAPLALWHRFRCSGLEHVPDGACLLVANHSAGAIVEVLLVLRAWTERHPERPARGLAHQVAFQRPFKWAPVSRLGAILAHPEVARRSLARGDALLVFPGGDLEASRSFADRYRVTLGGRTGFARLAREAGVPIVPLVICGSHAPYVVLPGGEAFARVTGLARLFGLKSFPLTIGAVTSLASAALALVNPFAWPLVGLAIAAAAVPLPSRIEAEALPPIHPIAGESDEALGERVRVAMQQAMDRMAAGRSSPWT